MKKIIIIIVALVLIVGCGGAVWFFMQGADVPFGDETEKEDKAASLDESEFVDIENLSVPVIREGRVDKYITISLSLEMRSVDARERAEEAMPRLKDAIFRDLYSYFSMQKSDQQGLNVNQVKARLLWATERAIGEGLVKQIIIQGAYERRGQFK
jgi:flagellar FliL protein